MNRDIKRMLRKIKRATPLAQALAETGERTPEQRHADAKLAAAWNQYFFDQEPKNNEHLRQNDRSRF